jgi:hypothetical protein
LKAVCPYTEDKLRLETAVALARHWRGEVRFVKLDPQDVFAYPNLLADLWAQQEDFALIEHDIVITPQVYQEFRDCPEPYCCFPYEWGTQIGPALGCTRFRTELVTRYPQAMAQVQAQRVGWRQTDVVLMRHVFARNGVQPHVHLPPVEHLNERKRLSADASREPVIVVPTS